jgi:hypothetical protein
MILFLLFSVFVIGIFCMSCFSIACFFILSISDCMAKPTGWMFVFL